MAELVPLDGRRYAPAMKHNQCSKRGQEPRLIDVDATNFQTLPCCGIKDPAHPGREEKREWLQANAKFGVRAKMLLSPGGDPCGYIEYMPGENAWRGVDAPGYSFIQCIWIPKKWQGRGWGSLLVKACSEEAKRSGRRGVAVVVRDGPWMSDRRLFVPTVSTLWIQLPPIGNCW